MKRPAIRRTGICLLGLCLAGGAVVVAACSDDEPAAPLPAPDGSAPGFDASTTPEAEGDGAAPADDAGVEDDGGGEFIDDDGGVIVDEDGGFDGGVECPALKPGAVVDTTCGNRILALSGGPLVTGTFELASVQIIGDKSACIDAGTDEHKGTLKVTATSTTEATFEFLDQGRDKPEGLGRFPFAVRRYSVNVSAKDDTLTFVASDCKLTKAPRSALYSASKGLEAKRSITLRLPYGARSFGIYRYVQAE